MSPFYLGSEAKRNHKKNCEVGKDSSIFVSEIIRTLLEHYLKQFESLITQICFL